MFVVAALILLQPDPAAWPQFRGPSGDGAALSANITSEWSESKNLRWKTPIHDKGWSSPVVLGDKIWLTTAREDGKEFFAICLDRKTGKILHDLPLLKVEKPEFCHPFNSYASPTPVLERDRVYAHFGRYGTFCLDAATGKTLWENRELVCDHYRGPGSSPVLYKNLLILTFDGYDVQFLAALDTATGRIAWKTPRDITFVNANPDYHKGYSTPQLVTIDGRDQLVSPAADSTIAYDPATGKELWRIATGGMNQSIRPIFAHGLVYLSCGHEQKLLAMKPGTGTLPATAITWKTIREAPTRPAPLVLGDHLFMVNDKGILTCLDAKSGKSIWRERLDGDFTASPVSAGNLLVLPNESGKTFVVQAGNEFKLIAANRLDAGCMASPAIIGNDLILRTKAHVYCIGSD
jgi:outer membrane protein assembly factor BamB